jgi:uncharacterized protein DUF1571
MNRLFVGLFARWSLPGLPIGWVALITLTAVWLAVDSAPAQDQSRALKRGSLRSKPAAIADDDAAVRDAASSEERTSKKEGAPLTLQDVIKYAEPSRKAMEEIKDYTAVFSKTELVKGRMIKQVMDMKFRTKPFSVYFRYRTGQEQGRQAIFVEGKFGNRLVVKEANGLGAIAGRLYFDLTDRTVMAENRYPVTHVGIGNLLNTALAVWERESKLEAAEVDVKFFPKAKLGDLPVEAVQLTHRKPLREIKFHMTRVYFDKETRLPLRAERYAWPRQAGEKPPLVEDYIYTNLKTNVNLTDAHFDPATYGF